MFLIAGLGNPLPEYDATRHNVGFQVIDKIAAQEGIRIKHKKFRALYGKGMINGEKVLLVKPQTYMNLSGESLRQFIDYYDILPKEALIVVCDDVHLPAGRLRIRPRGSAGGHNGLKNIIRHLDGSEDFIRVRVGVGEAKEGGDLISHVLGAFPKEERALMEKAEERAAAAVCAILERPIERVMDAYNRKEFVEPIQAVSRL